MDLLAKITSLSGVGEKQAGKLTRLNIYTLYDLLTHLPSRYQDRTNISHVRQIQAGEEVCVKGTLSPIKNQFTKSGKFIQTAIFSDPTGNIPVVWFNQIYLARNHRQDQFVTLFGKADFFSNHKITLISPEIGTSDDIGLIPIYPETAGITSKWLRSKIKLLLPTLPLDLYPLPELFPIWSQAIKEMHFPNSLSKLTDFKTRLELDELIIHILAGLIAKQLHRQVISAPSMSIDQKKLNNFIARLPFQLTPSQQQSLQEVLYDLTQNIPMNRLLEGDVGSGKTIISTLAAYITYLNGFKTLLLAPTQILATQHYQNFSKLFDFKIGFVTANQKITDSPIIIGTHALLNKKIEKVGLVIIDEQHKFGVHQRNLLANTHTLTMTATPIPRSVALTLYGNLDFSILEKRNSQQEKIKTWIIPEEKRLKSYQWINDEIQKNKSQAYIVCPFIDPAETLSSVKSATAEYSRLKTLFPNLKLDLLHGRLSAKEKDAVMDNFHTAKTDILVCTPVVEVGIDNPNATIILIEDADRFGLAQLHQLRGRVGRGKLSSYCLLFSTKDTDRLKVLTTTHSGLELAEADLKLRGPGQIFGTLQHGFIPFRVASFTNPELVLKARTIADALLPDLPKYPFLKRLVEKVKIPEYDTAS